MAIRRKGLFQAGLIVLALSAMIVGASLLHLTERGLRQVPDFSRAATESLDDARLPEILYSARTVISTSTTWGALQNMFELSPEMVAWSYACTMDSEATFDAIEHVKISSGEDIFIVLSKGACPDKGH